MLLLSFILSMVLKVKTWTDKLDDFAERKFLGWATDRSPRRRSVRLVGPEDLEARITPANTDLWVGAAGANFNVATNWSINGQNGVPQNGDTLQFGGAVGGVNGRTLLQLII